MNKNYLFLFVLLVLLCDFRISVAQKGDEKMAIIITSSSFKEGEMIPSKYTCDGLDISPPLKWEQVPQGTKSFAIIMDDPDAPMGTWVHWVVWNIPAETNSLAAGEGTPLPDGSKQGVTSAGTNGYHGPCPPGGAHRYYFKIYALDTMLNLPESSKKQDLLDAVKGHILAQGSLMGKYKRK